MRTVGLSCLVVIASAGLARAQLKGSPRDTSIEVKFGGYLPGIDDEFHPYVEHDSGAIVPATRPYEEIFGQDERNMFMAVYERHLYQSFGTLSAGFGVGYWSADADGIPEAGSQATDTTGMTIIPVMVQATYRFDMFEDFVPLVPIAGLGVDYYSWRIRDGSGGTAEFEKGKPASGGTWGWHGRLGVFLLLDTLAPEMAADFDRDAGVNGSYLTFEYHYSQVNDFGSEDSFRLGDDAFLIGFAFDL